jgi:hypothetical protein
VVISENRFERWFSKGRFSRPILILASLFLWLLCDSLIALVIVKTGYAKPEEFFATSLRSLIHSRRHDIPEIQNSLSWHARFYPQYADRFQADGLLGTRLIPNFLSIILRPGNEQHFINGADDTFWFMTDEQGFPPVARLGHRYLLRKPADVFRVIMLGGSTVEGYGVNSPLESLPSKLQLLLEREVSQTSKQVEVINGGISHFSSDQEYLRLIADLVRFEPDLVIAYDGWNDAQLMPATIAGDPRTRPYRTESQEDNGDRVNTSFSPGGAFGLFATLGAGRAIEWLNHFSTFRLLHYSIRRITEALQNDDGTSQGPSFKPELSVEAAQVYMENRERMLFVAKQKGFHFASFLQPIIGIDGKQYTATETPYLPPVDNIPRREHEVFYRTVRPLLAKFASTNELSGLSCVADISTTSFAGVSSTVYADPGHLLANGNALVAQQILSELKRCKLLPEVQRK